MKKLSNRIGERRRLLYLVAPLLILLVIVASSAGSSVISPDSAFADGIGSPDIVTDVALIFGVRYWSAPADDDWPFLDPADR